MAGWSILSGGESDIPSLLALWRVAETLPSATDTEHALKQLLRRDPGSLLLAQAEAELIGSLVVCWDGWRGSFYRLAVHPAWRRNGLAAELIRAGEQRLRELRAIRLTAIVASEERAAMELSSASRYERHADVSRFVRLLSDGD